MESRLYALFRHQEALLASLLRWLRICAYVHGSSRAVATPAATRGRAVISPQTGCCRHNTGRLWMESVQTILLMPGKHTIYVDTAVAHHPPQSDPFFEK